MARFKPVKRSFRLRAKTVDRMKKLKERGHIIDFNHPIWSAVSDIMEYGGLSIRTPHPMEKRKAAVKAARKVLRSIVAADNIAKRGDMEGIVDALEPAMFGTVAKEAVLHALSLEGHKDFEMVEIELPMLRSRHITDVAEEIGISPDHLIDFFLEAHLDRAESIASKLERSLEKANKQIG